MCRFDIPLISFLSFIAYLPLNIDFGSQERVENGNVHSCMQRTCTVGYLLAFLSLLYIFFFSSILIPVLISKYEGQQASQRRSLFVDQ